MSSRRLQDMSSRRLEDVFSVTILRLPRRLEDISGIYNTNGISKNNKFTRRLN